MRPVAECAWLARARIDAKVPTKENEEALLAASFFASPSNARQLPLAIRLRSNDVIYHPRNTSASAINGFLRRFNSTMAQSSIHESGWRFNLFETEFSFIKTLKYIKSPFLSYFHKKQKRRRYNLFKYFCTSTVHKSVEK